MSNRFGAKIIEAASLDPDARTEEHVDDILDFVRDVKFFTRLSTYQQRQLCRTMSLEVFEPKKFVFQMGDIGDKFYIVLSGSLGVQVQSRSAVCPTGIHSDKCDCPDRPWETVVFLERGMGFGELALQSDQPRSASIQASERTELLVTTRAEYETYAGTQHRQFTEQRVLFLRQCPRIEDALQLGLISMQDISAMANCLNEVHLTGNAVICRQGEVADHIVFVRSGQLASLRCLDFDESKKKAAAKAKKHRGAVSRSSIDASVLAAMEKEQKDPAEMDGTEGKWEMTQNFGKAMMEMRRNERHHRMEGWRQKGMTSKGSSLKLGVVSTEGIRLKSKLPEQGEERTPGSGVSPDMPPVDTAKGKALWKKVQTSVTTFGHLDRFLGRSASVHDEALSTVSEASVTHGLEAAKQNIEHFSSVQAARKRYTEYAFKKSEAEKKQTRLLERKQKHSRGSKVSAASVPDASVDSAQKKHLRILRLGTLGPYEYFGDQQVAFNEVYPVSLASDPVADIYLMSKYDVMRRIPKKLFSALFQLEKDVVPSDLQVLEMFKQNERWNAFRRSMHGEALGNLRAKKSATTLRDFSSGSKVNAAANLEFLGISPCSSLGSSLLALPKNKAVGLRPKDEEFFSQASARFLRRFDLMKRDKGLRNSLAAAGVLRDSRLHDGLPGSGLDDDDQDAMAFRFDQHWYKLRKDPIGLDLDDALSDSSKLGGRSSDVSNSSKQVLQARVAGSADSQPKYSSSAADSAMPAEPAEFSDGVFFEDDLHLKVQAHQTSNPTSLPPLAAQQRPPQKATSQASQASSSSAVVQLPTINTPRINVDTSGGAGRSARSVGFNQL